MRNLKRALSLALASVMLLGMMVVGTSADYADVTSAHNEEAIAVAQAAGIMIGDDAGNFNPDQKVTRNEAAVVMSNLMGYNTADYAGIAPFTDVPAWAEPYVSACYANGIVAGTSATTYGGNDTVTAAQMSLMVAKALGYFQFQADFGDDWKLATIKVAADVELLDGTEAAADTTLTRNDVAQIVLNALEADVMDYSGSQGSNITTSDGTSINIGYTIKYDINKTTSYNYNGETDTEVRAHQQLVEKLFKNKLTKTSIVDDFYRPAYEWKWDGESIGKYAKDAKLTYTKQVDGKTLYEDLGLSATFANVDVYENGEAAAPATIDIVKNDKTTKVGGAGTITEVYVKTSSVDGTITDIDIIEMQVKYGKISSVGKDADENRIVRVGGNTYKTEAFNKDDLVMYTFVSDDNVVKTMEKVEKQAGKLTKTVGTDMYIDGTKYPVNVTKQTGDAYSVGDKIDFIVDANGYVIWAGLAESAASLDNLAFVEGAGPDRGGHYATLRLADGTKMVVDTDKDYYTAGTNNMRNQIVMFEETDNGYKLTKKTSTALGADAYATDDAVETDTQGIALNNSTTFVYAIDNSGDMEYKVYTGYKAAPTFSTANTVAYEKDGVAVLVYVYVDDSNITDTQDELTLIVYDADVKVTDEKNVDNYYEYAAVVDGEITTVKVFEDLYSTVASYGVLTNNVKFDTDGVIDYIGALSSTVYKTDSAVKVAGGVITFGATKDDDGNVLAAGTGYAYTDDVQVYTVSDKQVISEITISDIEKDENNTDNNAYAQVQFHLDTKGKVDFVVVFEA